ncbi:MAG: peptide-methionine (R)-S-oxide reductase MsrB [Brevinema sp.]
MKYCLFLLFLIIAIPNYLFTQNNQEYRAIFTGGFFGETSFKNLPGVLEIISGKEQLSSKKDSQQLYIVYDPNIISYQQILNIYLRTVDPTDSNQKAVIYTSSEEQQNIAQAFIQKLQNSNYFGNKKITVDVCSAAVFSPSSQQNSINNTIQNNFYRFFLGREKHLKKVWEKIPQSFLLSKEVPMTYTGNRDMEEKFARFVKPSQKELQEQLSPIQYAVTQRDSTEPPFKNEYFDSKERGLYVDIVSGEPLFSSRDKFDSGTGWPSFLSPVAEHFIVERSDFSLFVKRTEVRSRYADSHLGHVFDDGPNGALRYCMNSAALRFIPYDQMVEEGYADYLPMV